jgi:hypothetical protein
MKVTWESEDIRAGRRVGSPLRNERWMIGYQNEFDEGKYCLISLIDGMIAVSQLTKQQLADHLNKSGEIPEELLKTPTKG